MSRRDKIAAAVLFSLFFWAVLAVGAMDAADQIRHDIYYCDMYALHQESGGERGHPDYDNKAEQICNE